MQELMDLINKFVKERDWDKFHTPKNLVMALSIEVSELMEHFQWLSAEESYSLSFEKTEMITEEIGDIFIYFLRICEKLNINPVEAASEKLKKNEKKYPSEIVKGSMKKYTEY